MRTLRSRVGIAVGEALARGAGVLAGDLGTGDSPVQGAVKGTNVRVHVGTGWRNPELEPGLGTLSP